MTEALILVDANSGDNPHPYLIFDPECGTFEIVDDYEVTNDPTARDFVISKNDAVKLAASLLLYIQEGATSTLVTVNQSDVEQQINERTR
jgi:hypothetical protein